MKSRDETIAAFKDELTGIMLEGFTVGHIDAADLGRRVRLLCNKATQMLGRVHDFVADAPPTQPVVVAKAASVTNGHQPVRK